jgi:hypothetical protein
MLLMAPKPKPKSKPPQADRHKPNKLVRIPLPVALALEQLAAEQFNRLPDQVLTACREYLERQGRLPKPPGRDTST